MDTLRLPTVDSTSINTGRVLSDNEKLIIVTLLKRHQYFLTRLNDTRKIIRSFKTQLFDPPPLYSVEDPNPPQASVHLDQSTLMAVFVDAANPPPPPSQQPVVLPGLGELPPVAADNDVDTLVLTQADPTPPVAPQTEASHPVAADIHIDAAVQVRGQRNITSSTTSARIAHELRRIAIHDRLPGRQSQPTVHIDGSITIIGDGNAVLDPRTFSLSRRTPTRPAAAVTTAPPPPVTAIPQAVPLVNPFRAFAQAPIRRVRTVSTSAPATPVVTDTATPTRSTSTAARRRSPRVKRESESDEDYVPTKRRKRPTE